MIKPSTLLQDKAVMRLYHKGGTIKDIAAALLISRWQVYHAIRRMKNYQKI